MSASTLAPSDNNLFVYKYQTRRVLGTRQNVYQDTIETCRRLFTFLPNIRITLHTDELDICDGQLTEISEDLWEHVIGKLKSITVFNEEDPATLPAPPPYTIGRANVSAEEEDSPIIIDIQSLEGPAMSFRVQKSTKVDRAIRLFLLRIGRDINDRDIVFTFNGEHIDREDTIESLGMEDGDQITAFPVQRG